ncbi:MAG: Beta-barrel assembly-enhancing protease [Myxococcota bacterium]|nr:Beta-barrel assembly-enhancing protease [Myxococcota bacterium]
MKIQRHSLSVPVIAALVFAACGGSAATPDTQNQDLKAGENAPAPAAANTPTPENALLDDLDTLRRGLLENTQDKVYLEFRDRVRDSATAENLFLRGMANPDREVARTEMMALAQTHPSSFLGSLGKAALYSEARIWEFAEREFAKAKSLGGDNIIIQLFLADHLLRQDKKNDAVKLFDKVDAARPGGLWVTLARAEIHEAAGDTDKAIAAYEKALTRSPNVAGLHRKLAKLYLKKGEKLKSFQAWQKVAEFEPKDYEAVITLARTTAETGNDAEATKWYERAASIRPNDKEVLKAVLPLYKARGETLKEKAAIEKLLPDDPENRDYLLRMGQIAQQDNRPNDALAFYARLLKLDPGNVDALASSASLEKSQGRLFKAMAILNRVRKLNPQHPAVAGLAAWEKDNEVPATAITGKNPSEVWSKINGFSRPVYKARLKTTPGIKGKLSIRLTLGKDGIPSMVEIVDDSLKDDKMVNFIIGSALKAAWPGDEGASLSLDFGFSPGG